MEDMETDTKFVRFLKGRDITTETIGTLLKEGITDKDTLLLLGARHIELLLSKIPIGEHAKLMKAKEGVCFGSRPLSGCL